MELTPVLIVATIFLFYFMPLRHAYRPTRKERQKLFWHYGHTMGSRHPAGV